MKSADAGQSGRPKRECQEAVDERLARAKVSRLGIERLRGSDVDEERTTAAGSLANSRGEMCLGVIERLIRAVADSDDD